MSGGVLAVIGAALHTVSVAVADEVYSDLTAGDVEELREARDAVAELIESGKEYREAVAAREADDHGARKVYERAEAAELRFNAALSRANGGGHVE